MENKIFSVSILGKETIYVGNEWTNEWVGDCLKATPKTSTYVIVTDKTVSALHLSPVMEAFEHGIENNTNIGDRRVLSYVIPSGEAYKTRKVKEQVEDYMLTNGCTRDTCLIALGGGVVGDLAGYVAATFMRGIPVVQVPTTLLAMVDSSIGGKTAVDTPNGKNLIGAFWQPIRVYIDCSYLKTLPQRQFINGMAEIIKTGAFWDEKLFELLENKVNDILSNKQSLVHVIKECVSIKAHVVTKDERESGLRELLNFGHSVGHAIETVFAPHLLHGEAVSIGMVKEAEISRHLGHLKQSQVARLVRILKQYNLPSSMEDLNEFERQSGKEWKMSKLLEIMKVDKKNKGGKKKIVLLKSIGSTVETRASNVSDNVIERIIASSVIVKQGNVSSEKTIEIQVPGSKSISNRALLMAALGTGTCRITGLLHSDDTQVMLQAIHQLGGCQFRWECGGDVLVITGTGGILKMPDSEIYLGNAGTAARFLTTVCTLARSSDNADKVCITGNQRMKQRPIGPLVDALRANGSSIVYLESHGCLPLSIGSGFEGGEIHLSASVSSQYVSSILLSAPYAQKPVTLILGTPNDTHVVSQPYIDMTVAMMSSFGVNVKRLSPNKYQIPIGQYKNPLNYVVEPDASSSTYPLAYAALTGQSVLIRNLGRGSLQGDAEFAMKILKPMGCVVDQTTDHTIVSGPPKGLLKPLPPHIDMESMTDAFLTASVLIAAVPSGDVTGIGGIANQRVKECDRIAAVVGELKKFGVDAWELDDGLSIRGKPLAAMTAPVSIKCYDDHRVAMSFSVLLSALEFDSTVIEERKCVEKTWPEWWDVLANDFKANVFGSDFRLKHGVETRDSPSLSVDSSIVLIGMRGVGKSTLAKVAADHLAYKLVDIDFEIEHCENMKISELVSTKGWEYFRQCETKILQKILQENQMRAIISCGGGIVETQANINSLNNYRSNMFVIHLDRDIDDVISELKASDRPNLPDDLKQAFDRRLPLYENLRNYYFRIHTDNSKGYNWPKVNSHFCRFLDSIRGINSIKIKPPTTSLLFQRSRESLRQCSHFLSLNHHNVEDLIPNIPELCSGVDALELRVDCFDFYNDTRCLLLKSSLLQFHSKIPLIWTVRTIGQGGNFNPAEKSRYLELLDIGKMLGYDFIDVEFETLSEKDIHQLTLNRGFTKIIASYHHPLANRPWLNQDELIDPLIQKASRIGDICKLVMTATSLVDNFDLYNFLSSSTPFPKPLIAINMGSLGQMSRALNAFLSPVTHKLLPKKAAPGQLSVTELNQLRSQLGLIQPEVFYLFGSPISHSKSPEIHKNFFETMGLSNVYDYQLLESDSITKEMNSLMRADDYWNYLNWPRFGGASVTIPLKEAIIPHMDELTDAAKTIGAVNTVIPYTRPDSKENKLVGDNTDWLGIMAVLPTYLVDSCVNALVVGAGGTAKAACFAVKQLNKNVRLYVWNRTKEKAAVLAKSFNGELLAGDVNFDVVISTIPGDAQLQISDNLLLKVFQGEKSVLVELAYKPEVTRFIDMARRQQWIIKTGSEVLLEQAKEQRRRWIGH